jgi:hypothetical protein
MHPEDEPEWSDASLERARRGTARERDIVALLAHVGQRCTPRFSAVEQQKRYEIRDRDGVLLIVGKIDLRLRFDDGTTMTCDVKSGDSIRHVRSLDDLDRSPWTRHHVDQLLVYMLAESEQRGMLILDQPDGPLFLEVSLLDHLERAESFLRDARAAVDARFARAALPAHTDDRGECRRCPHAGKTCAPPTDYGAGAITITDPSLLAVAHTRDECAAAAAEYERADKALKQALRGIEYGILGDYVVRGRWQGATTYAVPEDIRQQYAQHDPRARFILTIERMS